MSDIFEEVEEEVRKDQMGDLWRRFGPFVWAAGLAIILAVAYNEFRGSQLERQREARMVTFEAAVTALETGDYATAQSSFEALVEADTSLSPLAAHYLAATRLEGGGDRAGAVEALALASGELEDGFAQLALLKSVYLRAESLTLEEMEAELAPLIALDTPMGALAEEAIAAKAFASGDHARARTEFNRLRFAANAPPGLIQRATIALEAIPRLPEDSSDEDIVEETDLIEDADLAPEETEAPE